MPIRTRIAPSPTGFPHVGTIFQALFDYVIAKQNHGQFIIRIEDTDQTRQVAGAEDALYASLEWAGITPDEGPKYGGDVGPYRQSERLPLYKKYALELINQGNAYYCFCSSERLDQVRKDMQAKGIPPMYDKHCRNLDIAESKKRSQSEPYVIRMKIPTNQTITLQDEIRGLITFDSNVVDDQVLLKSDGFPTYHLAVVIDDHLMNITHLIRGEEWISSAPKHILLYQYFGWNMPKFIHTPLLRNPDKSKLGKRHGHASVSWYQDNGYLPEALLNFLATRVWNHPDGREIFSLSELTQKFDINHMHIQGPIVDLQKLNWYNGIYIRQLSDTELLTRLKPHQPRALSDVMLKKLLPLIKERLVTLADLTELTDFVFDYHLPDTKLLLKKSDNETVSQQLRLTIDQLTTIKVWTTANIEQVLRGLQVQHNWNIGQYFMLIRLVVTGKTATPPLFETIEVLDKDITLARLNNVHDNISAST